MKYNERLLDELTVDLQAALNEKLCAAGDLAELLVASVQFYTDSGYLDINFYSRTRQNRPCVRGVTYAFRQLTVPAPNELILYRGAGGFESEYLHYHLIENYEVTVDFDTFISTSLNSATARRFIRGFEYPETGEIHTFMYEFHLPVGYPVIYTNPLSVHPDEDEVVLWPAKFFIPGGTLHTIIDDDEEPARYYHRITLFPYDVPKLPESLRLDAEAAQWLQEQARYYAYANYSDDDEYDDEEVYDDDVALYS